MRNFTEIHGKLKVAKGPFGGHGKRRRSDDEGDDGQLAPVHRDARTVRRTSKLRLRQAIANGEDFMSEDLL